MKYTLIVLGLSLNIALSQCDNLSESQCGFNINCEWIEDINWGSCGELEPIWNVAYFCDDLSTNSDNCYTYTCYGGGYGQWGTCCGGDPYIIADNSYCQEIEMPECSEINSEIQCDQDDECNWVEDIETAQCSQFDNFYFNCTNYPGECYWDEDITYASCNYPNSGMCNSVEGCYWDCNYGYCDCNGQEIIGVDTECIGQYEIDNSFCEDAAPLECSEIDYELQCNQESECEWEETITYGNCSNYNNGSSCDANSNCYWDLCYGGYYGSWSHCCRGGTYEIYSGSCEEYEISYIPGDANSDGNLNVTDVVLIVDSILNSQYNQYSDINQDGVLSVIDIIDLINIILGD